MEEGAAALLNTQQTGILPLQRHRLVGILGGTGIDAHMVEQRIKTVGLHHLAGQIGIDVLGIIAGLEDQRLAIHVADTGKAVHRRAHPQLHSLAEKLVQLHHVEVHQRAAGGLTHGGDLGGEGVFHAAAVGDGIGNEGTATALANHQALVLQLANGLANRVAAHAHSAAQLRLAGQTLAHRENAGGDIALDDAHQLHIQRNIAVEGQTGI